MQLNIHYIIKQLSPTLIWFLSICVCFLSSGKCWSQIQHIQCFSQGCIIQFSAGIYFSISVCKEGIVFKRQPPSHPFINSLKMCLFKYGHCGTEKIWSYVKGNLIVLNNQKHLKWDVHIIIGHLGLVSFCFVYKSYLSIPVPLHAYFLKEKNSNCIKEN